jgi:2-polyprenyl-6-methoxyphenol hydroxylase-like FAD-dependent oxidoreductase
MQIAILGGGIGGLACALFLHEKGVPCTVYESTKEYRAVGVGINLLSHAVKLLTELGLGEAMAEVGLEPRDFLYFNQWGQEIYCEPCGRHAGFSVPHYSFHRADLHAVLLAAVRQRLGSESVMTGHRVKSLEQSVSGVTVHFADSDLGISVPSIKADIAIGCDGIHSVVRRQFYPDEGPPSFGGINMWRGVTRYRPILGGDKVIRAGPLRLGKMVVYPIRNYPDGTQLINWVAEIQQEARSIEDWSKPGRLKDFLHFFKDWHFDWLDIPDLLSKAELILEYPMVDRDPLPRWSFDRITLLGDAAHPMYPRGGNGAAQSIIDGKILAELLCADRNDPTAALKAYEEERLPKTSRIVQTNRMQPPDFIIETVDKLTGGQRFNRIEDVISGDALTQIAENYRQITGGSRAMVNSGPKSLTPPAALP